MPPKAVAPKAAAAVEIRKCSLKGCKLVRLLLPPGRRAITTASPTPAASCQQLKPGITCKKCLKDFCNDHQFDYDHACKVRRFQLHEDMPSRQAWPGLQGAESAVPTSAASVPASSTSKSNGGIISVNNSSKSSVTNLSSVAVASADASETALKDIVGLAAGLVADPTRCTLVQAFGHNDEPVRALALQSGQPHPRDLASDLRWLVPAVYAKPCAMPGLMVRRQAARGRKRGSPEREGCGCPLVGL
jgi:hypothetical protein